MTVKSVTLVLLLSALIGCKLQKEKPAEVNGIEGYRVGDTIRTERFLNSDETTIAKRVCRDLRAKRNRWEINRDNIQLNFAVRSRTSCSGGLASYEIQASVDLASGDLMLETPSRSKFISEVLTDHHTAIQNICDEVLAGDAEVENTVEISGARFQSTFYEYQSGHFVLITRFAKDSAGVWKAALVDESRVVVLERTSSSDKIGVIDFRAQEAKCTGSGTTYVNQSLR
tara:strand:- start:10590 stop:11273 length:684 start_codon:yes stop_codon:yes gene_type:complete